MRSTPKATLELDWCLVGGADDHSRVRQVPIHKSPFHVGRLADRDLTLHCRSVSGCHAEIIADGQTLWVRDLQSTNGTFVNGARITAATQLNEGDLVQFGKAVFRVAYQNTLSGSHTAATDACDQALALVQLERLLADGCVTPHFQPIVSTCDHQTIGYEVLARSKLYGLREPAAMFLAAKLLELEGELSRLCRQEGVLASARFPQPPNLFLNTHPAELYEPDKLTGSLTTLRRQHPERQFTLEIHEAAVTPGEVMRELRARLCALNIALAYDDFGAGQARLIELVEVPPDYLKFDMKLVREIDKATLARQQMLSTLVRMARDLGIRTLAEGVESEAEAVACRELGFDLLQGYYYGRPAPASRYATLDSSLKSQV